MPTGNTSLLGLALPVQGELTGTWGDVVNDSITSLVDSAVAGTTTLSADADVTLTDTSLSANQARQAVILWTASNGATTRNITAPARSKAYVVINAGTGSIVLRGAGPTTGVTIASGRRSLVAWNGSDFVEIAGGLVNLATGVTGVLPPPNGGTGLSSVGSNGQVLTVVSGAPAWQTPASGLPSQTGNAGKYLFTNGTVASWENTGASAGGVIWENSLIVSANYTLTTGKNGFSVGPITINSGVSVTVPSGQRWVIL